MEPTAYNSRQMTIFLAIIHHEQLFKKVTSTSDFKELLAFEEQLQNDLVPVLIEERAPDDLIKNSKILLRNNDIELRFQRLELNSETFTNDWKTKCETNLVNLKEWFNEKYIIYL